MTERTVRLFEFLGQSNVLVFGMDRKAYRIRFKFADETTIVGSCPVLEHFDFVIYSSLHSRQ